MAEETTKIIRLVIDSTSAIGNARGATREMERLDRQLASMDSTMSKMERALSSMGTAIKAHLALAVAEIAARFVQLAKDSLSAVAGLDELAEQLGITTTGLQALQFSAVQNGLKLGELETAVGQFSRRMGEAAGGSKEMVEALQQLGVKNLDKSGGLRSTEALMSDVAEAILKIEDPARRAAMATELFGRAGQKMLPMLSDVAAGVDVMATKARDAGAMIDGTIIKKLDKMSDEAEVSALKMRALFATIGAPIITTALEAVNKILSDISANLDRLKTQAATASIRAAQNDVSNLDDQIAAQRGLLAINPNNQSALSSIKALERRKAEAVERAAIERDQYAAQLLVSGTFPPTSPVDPGGDRTSTVKGGSGGESPEEKYAKLTIKLQEAARAQDEMTAAAARGDVAFTAAQVHLEAVQKTLEIFGRRLADNDPLLVELEARMLRIARGKLAEAFSVATNELQSQNAILEAQNRLMGEAPELIAREIAQIKVKQDIEKAGGKISQDEIDRRYQAVETGEKLKVQAEDLKRSQELWLSPVKQALESIQQSTADWIDSLLEGLEQGKLSFADFGKAGIAIIRRMVSEILSLAIIRPVLGSVLNGLAGMGVIGQGTIRQLGYGTTGGASMGAGGGGSAMPSFGGGSGSGGMFGFLGRPIMGAEAYNTAQMTASLTGASMPWYSGITWGQGLGAAAGIGMGAYQLLAGNGSTASTIGGIGSMIGGAVSLIPGVGQIAGPAIAILSSILPSLFGESKPTITNQEYGQLSYGANGFGTSGGAWGPSANAGNLQGPLGQMGTTMQSIFDALGGVRDSARVWGVALESFAQQYGNGSNFANQTSFLVGPGGQKRQWGMGSNAGDIGMEAAGVQATLNSILDGAVGDISENMRKALAGVNDSGKATFETLAVVVSEVKAFDDAVAALGKTTTGAEQALKAIDDQFAGLRATAEKYGLDLAKVEEEQGKARLKVATDFGDGLQRALDDMVDPTKGLLADLDKEKQAAIDTNRYLVENVTGAQDQIAKIEDLYGKKRAAIVEESTRAAAEAEKRLADQREAFAAQRRDIELEVLGIDNPMAAQIGGWQREMAQYVKGVTDTFGAGSTEAMQASADAISLFSARMKAANDNFVTDMRDMVTALEDPFKVQIDGLMRARDAAMKAAQALDSTGKLMQEASLAYAAPIEKMARDFKGSIDAELLSARDPLGAQLKALGQEKAEQLKKAGDINDALMQVYGPTYQDIVERGNAGEALTDADREFLQRMKDNRVDMLQIEEAYLQKELKLKEDYFRQSLGGIQDLIKRLTVGDLSGANATEAIAGGKASYMAALAQARANPLDQARLDAFAQAANDYGTLSRNTYGNSTDFYAIQRDMLAAARQLDASVRAAAGNGGVKNNTNDEENAAMFAEVLKSFGLTLADFSKANGKTNDLLVKVLTELQRRKAVA